MLALYDLCAVLTPCGPLKMLVGLMQERNEPLPGLLYEANLPPPTDFSQNQDQRKHQERVTIPSPMSLGVGMGLGSWAMMMGIPGYVPPGREEDIRNSPANSDLLSQSSSDAGGDVETSGHGLLPGNGNISLAGTEPPVVRRKPIPSAAAASPPSPPAHYDGRVEGTQFEDEYEKGDCPFDVTMNLTSPFASSEHSIKLGLGDFVFYSVLVSRAATYGFSAFVACSLVILGVPRHMPPKRSSPHLSPPLRLLGIGDDLSALICLSQSPPSSPYLNLSWNIFLSLHTIYNCAIP
jgi:presenilin 1